MTNRNDPSDLQVYGAEDDEDMDNILDALEKAAGNASSADRAAGDRA